MHLFISCPPKLEQLLAEELQALDIEARKWPRGVSAPLSMQNVYRINMESHIATRVLWPLKRFKCTDRHSLHKELLSIAWEEWISPEKSFAVDANVTLNNGFKNSHFAALIVKDAICDYFRSKTSQRPSVDVKNPQVQFNLFIYKEEATLSFDTSGTPLFKRGYRIGSFEAPIQETLAAAVLKMAHYTSTDVLYDPFCGSGTFLWEAALIATQTAPGFLRKQWAFFHHPQFSSLEWDTYVSSLRERRKPLAPFSILGSDRDDRAIQNCRAVAQATQFPITFQRSDIRLLNLPRPPTLVVTNPPYGVRLKSSSDPYQALAHFLETTCQGKAAAAILSPLPRLPSFFRGKRAQPIPVVNGGLDIFVHFIEAS